MHKTLSFVHEETTRSWISYLHAVAHSMKEGKWITEKSRDMHKGNSFVHGTRLCWLQGQKTGERSPPCITAELGEAVV
ncbi:MAG: hypothetical protein WCX65_17575, partial [bacterium]